MADLIIRGMEMPKYFLNWALRQIKALPTIVPAEGGTENDGNA